DDYVLVSPSTRAKDGDIVAARLGEDATVKTLTHRGASIVLEPANDADRAIEVGPKDDFAVLGVVCGVFRPFMEQTAQPNLPVASDTSLN
ncbi:MAG: S24 family peptidase, partial [Gemmatimonadaceae bacterium]